MKFISQSSSGILTDGHLSCNYQDIPRIFSQLTDYFAKHGICSEVTVHLPHLNLQ